MPGQTGCQEGELYSSVLVSDGPRIALGRQDFTGRVIMAYQPIFLCSLDECQNLFLGEIQCVLIQLFHNVVIYSLVDMGDELNN